MADLQSQTLLERIRHGDELAAEELLDRYADRLIALAGSRLSKKLARRLDPEDIVQSACRSFFRQARAGRYEVRDSDDLWRLLAAITVHKAVCQVRHHTAGKRALSAEESAGAGGILHAVTPEALAREPLPDDATVLVEETELMLERLSKLQRRILELSLQGLNLDAVAEQAECSERSVQRAIKLARTHLERRLFGNEGGDISQRPMDRHG